MCFICRRNRKIDSIILISGLGYGLVLGIVLLAILVVLIGATKLIAIPAFKSFLARSPQAAITTFTVVGVIASIPLSLLFCVAVVAVILNTFPVNASISGGRGIPIAGVINYGVISFALALTTCVSLVIWGGNRMKIAHLEIKARRNIQED